MLIISNQHLSLHVFSPIPDLSSSRISNIYIQVTKLYIMKNIFNDFIYCLINQLTTGSTSNTEPLLSIWNTMGILYKSAHDSRTFSIRNCHRQSFHIPQVHGIFYKYITDVQSLEQSGYKTTVNLGTNKYIFIHLSKTEKV